MPDDYRRGFQAEFGVEIFHHEFPSFRKASMDTATAQINEMKSTCAFKACSFRTPLGRAWGLHFSGEEELIQKNGRCVILLRHLLSSCFKISVQLQNTFNLSTNRWDFGGRCVTLLRRIFLTIHSKQLTMTHKEFYLFKRWVGETFWFGQNTVHESYCDDWSAWTRRTEQGHVLPFRHEAVGQEGSLSEYTACRKATKASSAVMTKTFGVSCLNSEEAQHFSLFLLNHDMRFADSGQRTKVQPCETRRTLRLGCRAPEMSLWRMFFLGISRRWGTSIKRRFQSRLSLCFCRKELVSPTTRSFRAYGQLYPIVILAGLEKGEMSDD